MKNSFKTIIIAVIVVLALWALYSLLTKKDAQTEIPVKTEKTTQYVSGKENIDTTSKTKKAKYRIVFNKVAKDSGAVYTVDTTITNDSLNAKYHFVTKDAIKDGLSVDEIIKQLEIHNTRVDTLKTEITKTIIASEPFFSSKFFVGVISGIGLVIAVIYLFVKIF